MNFQELVEYCQAEAISNKLSPTVASTWRQYCRTYSKLFSTPLPDVLRLEPLEVLLHVYEEQFGDVDVEENMEGILDMIYSLEDPEYDSQKRADLKSFIKDAEKEEKLRKKSGRPIHRDLAEEVSTKNTLPENETPKKKEKPRGGSINLSYLEREETEDYEDSEE